jgi:Na+/proline symporter
MIMAMVTLAAIKIGGVMLGFSPVQTVVVAGAVTVVYCMLGGLTGVLLTDLLQFCMAMIGAVAAAWFALKQPQVGGLSGLLSHPALAGKLSILPDFSNMDLAVSVFIIPLAVQWWSVWYPGAEPGGGGYIAQRMLAARDEKNALGATFLFNAAHYALRPWPWIIVALCSLVVFPNLESLQAAFPNIDPSKLGHDLGYPAMLTFLPAGLLGLVVASLIAAYMSTISTHLNWGSSYIVNDVYKRFLKPEAGDRELVFIGRIATLLLMVFTCIFALFLQNAFQAFTILLQIGAGTGLLFLLRWFWWRINAWSELAAMIISFAVALVMQFGVGDALAAWQKLVLGVGITTVGWVLVTLVTRPTDERVLREFVRKIQPGGAGWQPVVDRAAADGETLGTGAGSDVPLGLLCMLLGCVAVYGALFATGYFIYGKTMVAVTLSAVTAIATVLLVKQWERLCAPRGGAPGVERPE